MTRTLWKLIGVLLITSLVGGCSLFGGDEDSGAGSELDSESVSTDVVLDSEDEMLEETNDLTASSDEVGLDSEASEESFAEEDSFGEESFGEEAATDEFESEDVALDSEFDEGGDDFSEDEFSEEGMEISSTSEEAVDQQLAQDELDEFDDFDEAGQDDFALEENQLEDELMGDSMADPLEDSAGDTFADVPQDAAGYDNQVTNLAYKAFENGGTVVIETSSPAQYQKILNPDLNQVIIQVDNVFLPERFKRPYVTKDFKQDIATINAYADDTGAARFVIQLKRPINPAVQAESNSILVMTAGGAPMQQAANTVDAMDAVDPLEGPGSSEQPLDQLVDENQMQVQANPQDELGSEKDIYQVGSGQADTLAATGGGITRANGVPSSRTQQLQQSFGGVEKSGLSLSNGSFVGEKISIDFVDTDVRSIIEVISELSGVNLIMDKEVDGKTSIRLRDVPWDQALLVLLRSQGLGYVKQGSVLRIAKQATLSKEAQAVSKQIKSEKEAKLLAGGIKVKYIPVSYAKVSELASKLKDFTSKEGKIAFDDRTSSLVITDYGEFIERIVDLVKALDTAPMQVEIEAKLVEARETFVREAGINWDWTGQEFPFGSGKTGNLTAGSDGNLPGQGLTLDLTVGQFDIFGDLSAALAVFESDDKIKVLSQPRIVTMNKVPAEIKQTLQVPIAKNSIALAGQAPVQSFELLDVILGLKVTPQITFKGDVILEVDLQRDFAGARLQDGSRELNKRQAKSTVMVKNGKTAVIGGIYQLDDGDIETGVPLLKDIPLLGYLFKQVRTEKIKNELLLFLKPKVLREIDGPMVTKAGAGANYDAFEELSVDEGARSNQLDKAPEEDSSMEFEGDLEETLDDEDFEEDLEELSL